ncbi:uncharacterized protein LOC142356102 isoform X1 [Convolutriloba macropyga]|uniref:uncharacterized protein LOC142356102 isoform X1 n=1 Tax=Convolutriloba macropyga TaxID=536237 RepID=UPI003F51BC02
MASLGTNCLKYAVFAGSSKDAKLDEKVMKYVVRVIRDTRHETVIFGPDSMDIPFVKKPVHYYSDRSQAPEWLRDAEKKLETCDGFIYLCPEVNRSIPANLSNMIDHFGSNVYQAKPAAIITYSDTADPTGGILVSQLLSIKLMSLGAHILPLFVHIPPHNVPQVPQTTLDQNGAEAATPSPSPNGEAQPQNVATHECTKNRTPPPSTTKLQMGRLIEQFDWLAKALAFRKEGNPFPSKPTSMLSVHFE